MIVDMSVNPQMDMRVETYRVQARHNIATSDPLIVLGAPPCTVFSSMQNINQKHHGTRRTGRVGMRKVSYFCNSAVDVYWDQVARGKFFLHEHPATASSWDLPDDKGLGRTPWCNNCYRGYVSMGNASTFEESHNQGTEQSVLVKKPTKWMTNCPALGIDFWVCGVLADMNIPS